MIDLQGKIVAVLGAGRSGRAAAALAQACGAEVHLFDNRSESAFANLPEGVHAHPEATAADGGSFSSDLVITSPGIETAGEFVQSFAKKSGGLWGEVELAYRCFAGEIIAITGTNGKTTTTEAVANLLRATGVTSEPCGNHGRPLSELVLDENPPQVAALELSSFQLETIRDFQARARIWLNFAPDHMDRYRSLEEYHAAKARIFDNWNPDDLAVVRYGENLDLGDRRVTTFSAESDNADWILRDGNILRHGEPYLPMSGTRLYGRHNAENVMAACAAVESLRPLEAATAATALSGYAPPLHRCELIRILDGVVWLNDSKATNLHSMESAIKALDQPVVLLAGGKQKGLDYTPLRQLAPGRVSFLITYGEIRDELASVFSDLLPVHIVEGLEEAVPLAQKTACKGEIVLLSPGTSSFDQYSGYEARGDHFRKLVLRLH